MTTSTRRASEALSPRESKANPAGTRSEGTEALRRRIKSELEDQIWDFFTVQGGQVVIYDANNGNSKARKECYDKFEGRGVHVIFLGQSASLAPGSTRDRYWWVC